MTVSDRAQPFVDALRRLEDDGDPDALVELFAADGECENVTGADPARGADQIRSFWQDDRGVFESVHSEFRSSACDGDVCTLEWVRTGTGRSGNEVRYGGVTVLEFAADGSIARLAAYYDPSRLGDQALG